jgi:hypothetical protein
LSRGELTSFKPFREEFKSLRVFVIEEDKAIFSSLCVKQLLLVKVFGGLLKGGFFDLECLTLQYMSLYVMKLAV